MDRAAAVEPRPAGRDLVQEAGEERHGPQRLQVEQAGPQPVVEVVRVIGDVIGDRRHLGLAAGVAVEPEAPVGVELQDRRRDATRMPLQRPAVGVHERAIVLDQPLERFPGEIEAVECCIAALEPRHDAQRLGVVVETAIGSHAGIERIFARMTEGRVAEIMRQRQRLGQILVQAQRPRQ